MNTVDTRTNHQRRLRRLARWFGGGVGVWFILSAGLHFSPLRQITADWVEARTGRAVAIGWLAVGWSRGPALVAGSVRYPNASWGKSSDAIDAARVSLDLSWSSLLRGELRGEITVRRARVEIEHRKGKRNLPSWRTASTAARSSMAELPGIAALNIMHSAIKVHSPHRQWEIDFADVRIARDELKAPLAIDFHGAIEQTPLRARGTLGTLQTMVARKPSTIELQGALGDDNNRFRIDGTVARLSRWRDARLTMNATVEKVSTLSRLAGVRLADIGVVTGAAQLVQPQGLRSMQLQAIELESRGHGLHGVWRGRIERLISLQGIDIDISMDGAFTPAVNWLPGDAAPPHTAMQLRIHGARNDLTFAVINAIARNAAYTAWGNGALQRKGRNWRGELPLSLRLNHLGDAPRITPQAVATLGVVHAFGYLIRRDNAWHLRDISARIERDGLRAQANGELNRLLRERDGRFAVRVEMDDMHHLQPFFATTLPPLSALRLESSIDYIDGNAQARIDSLEARGYGLDWSARGAIARLFEWREPTMTFSARGQQLYNLPFLPGQTFALDAPLTLRANLIDDARGFHLRELHASVDGAVRGQVRGAMHYLGAKLRADLAVALDVQDIAKLRAAGEWSPRAAYALDWLSALAPAMINAKVTSRGARQWRADNLRIESRAEGVDAALSGRLVLTDTVAATATVADVDDAPSQLRIAIGRLPSVRLPIAMNFPDGVLGATFNLSGAPWQVHKLRAHIEAPRANLDLRVDHARFHPLQWRGVVGEVTAERAADLGDTRLQPDNRTVIRVSGDKNRATLTATIGASDVHGAITLTHQDARARWVGRLDSARVDLRDLIKRPPKKSNWFSTTPFNSDDIARLRRSDAQIDWRIDRFTNRFFDLHDAHNRIDLTNGELHHSVAADMGGGDVAATFSLNANVTPFSFALSMHGDQAATTALPALREESYLAPGTFDARIAFAAAGESPAALAANVDGRVSVRLNRTKIKNQSINVLGGDLFTNIITAINPFISLGEYVDIECGNVDFEIDKGKALIEHDGFALKTDQVTLFGAGDIDFDGGSLRILIAPKARKGFGVSPSSLVKLVRIGGTLESPKIEADPAGLLGTGVAVLSGIYSGGLSVLAQGLYDRRKANAEACSFVGDGES